MQEVYIPLDDAVKEFREFCYPQTKADIRFVCSERGVKVPRGENPIGLAISPIVKTEDGKQFYDEFRVPKNQDEHEALMNWASKTGRVGPHPLYKKFMALQQAMGLKDGTMDDILAMFSKAHVRWDITLEVRANSKEVEDWDSLEQWVKTNIGKGPKFNDGKDGTHYLSWRIYQETPDLKDKLAYLETVPGVRFTNAVNGYEKPVRVV